MTGICGKRYNDDTGHIKFLRPLGLPDKRVRYVWIIQASSAAKLKFYFTAFMLKSSCAETFINIYDGHDERNSTQNYHFCAASLPTGIFELKGPFITVYLTGNGTTLAKEGFSLLYGPAITSKCFHVMLLKVLLSQHMVNSLGPILRLVAFVDKILEK